MNRHLTVHQAAEELGVSHKTIRRAIDAGQLPALRVGRALRIERVDFEAWRETLRYVPAGGGPPRPRRPSPPRAVRGEFTRRARGLPADRGGA